MSETPPHQPPSDPETRMPNWPVGPFIHACFLQMLTEPPRSAGCCARREGHGGKGRPTVTKLQLCSLGRGGGAGGKQ